MNLLEIITYVLIVMSRMLLNFKVFVLQIRFLSCMKPPKRDLVECFSLFFADSSMARYNWSGISGHRFPKVAMMGYSIFTDCMLGGYAIFTTAVSR